MHINREDSDKNRKGEKKSNGDDDNDEAADGVITQHTNFVMQNYFVLRLKKCTPRGMTSDG